jgi:hypothetical protein
MNDDLSVLAQEVIAGRRNKHELSREEQKGIEPILAQARLDGGLSLKATLVARRITAEQSRQALPAIETETLVSVEDAYLHSPELQQLDAQLSEVIAESERARELVEDIKALKRAMRLFLWPLQHRYAAWETFVEGPIHQERIKTIRLLPAQQRGSALALAELAAQAAGDAAKNRKGEVFSVKVEEGFAAMYEALVVFAEKYPGENISAIFAKVLREDSFRLENRKVFAWRLYRPTVLPIQADSLDEFGLSLPLPLDEFQRQANQKEQ